MDNLWIIYEYGWWLSHPSEKYEFVNWDDDIPNMENKKCSKPPTRLPDISMDISTINPCEIVVTNQLNAYELGHHLVRWAMG